MFDGLDPAALVACTGARWSPRIGDPTLWGWLTVAAYAACAVLAVAVARRQPGRARAFWAAVALAMALLAVNKQLDLQILLTAVGRCIAQAQGWYEQRRSVQREFVLVLLALTGVALALAAGLMRRHLRQNGLALAGLVLVAGFVAIRAAGFYHVDALVHTGFHSVRANFLLENAGLLLIALNALALLRRGPGR